MRSFDTSHLVDGMSGPHLTGPGPLSQVGVDRRQGEGLLTVLHLREAPVFTERTSDGLDVHARSIVGCGLDTVTGEMARRRVTPTFEGVTGLVGGVAGAGRGGL